MKIDIGQMNAKELVDAFGKKSLSPVEVCQGALNRIEQLNPTFNAFAHVRAEAALKAAHSSEARWMKGEPRGPLDGVTASIKELTAVRGMLSNSSSLALDSFAVEQDAPIVLRLKTAGAVILGTTTSPEFGWKGVTDSPAHGLTRNPWNSSKTSGGSSGGAAVAAVLGMGVLHQGSDAGGSIRIPCGFSGCFGIKPTFGWVPQVPTSPMTWLSHSGPMSRTVEDSALMLQTIAGRHSGDWYSSPPSDTPDWMSVLKKGIGGLKIAFSPTLGYVDVAPEVSVLVSAAVGVLESLGANIEEVDPDFDYPLETFKTLWWAGAAKIAAPMSTSQRELLDVGFREIVARGEQITAAQYLGADCARAALGTHMASFHEQYDLLVTPTLPIPAFDVGQNVPDNCRYTDWPEWTPFSYPFNLTQQPACSIPCGFTEDGLPVGLQIVGPKFRDDLVLQVATAYEAAASLPRPASLAGVHETE